MRNYFLCFISFLGAFTSALSQQKTDKSVLLSVAVVKGRTLPRNVVDDYVSDADLKLVIQNNTDTVTTFYRTWNIWGDNAIRFELTIKDSVFNLYYSSYCDSRNFPEAKILQPGDSMVILIKVQQCYYRGPCPCLYSLPREYRFPSDQLLHAKLRAYYKVNMETHQQQIETALEIAKIQDSQLHVKRKSVKQTQKILDSFVTSELASDVIEINIDTWL